MEFWKQGKWAGSEDMQKARREPRQRPHSRKNHCMRSSLCLDPESLRPAPSVPEESMELARPRPPTLLYWAVTSSRKRL